MRFLEGNLLHFRPYLLTYIGIAEAVDRFDLVLDLGVIEDAFWQLRIFCKGKEARIVGHGVGRHMAVTEDRLEVLERTSEYQYLTFA